MILFVPFGIVLAVIGLLIWAYFAGQRIERREEADRAIRLAELERARPRRQP